MITAKEALQITMTSSHDDLSIEQEILKQALKGERFAVRFTSLTKKEVKKLEVNGFSIEEIFLEDRVIIRW